MASDPGGTAPDTAKAAREARLAEALRANLRRRKVQARTQNGPKRDVLDPPADDMPVSGED